MAILVITSTIPAIGGFVWAPYITLEASLRQRVVPAPLLGWVFGARRAPRRRRGRPALRATTPTVVIGLSALAGSAGLCAPALHRLPRRATPPSEIQAMAMDHE